MKFYGLLKTTLLDFPGLVACTVFTAGCNMRCAYCHNSELTVPNLSPSASSAQTAETPDSSAAFTNSNAICPKLTEYTEEDILNFVYSRKKILKGICISGGEPTLNPELYYFIVKLKKTGIAIKLDTNGTNPELVKKLCSENLIDYIAMDIKGAPCDYERVTGISEKVFVKIKETADFLKTCGTNYEYRTTVAKDMLSPDSFTKIGKWLSGGSKYFLQYYKEADTVPDKTLETPSEEEMYSYLNILKPYMPNTALR